MRPFRQLAASAATAVAALGACQASKPDAEAAAWTPAVLAPADAAALEALQAALAQAMGVARVALGPGDPAAQPTVAVLPPPLGPQDDRSLALPTAFDIVTDGARCAVMRRDDGAVFALDGVRCRPFAP